VLLPREALDLPLTFRARIQSRVWRALRQIPLGENQQLQPGSRRLGEPRADSRCGVGLRPKPRRVPHPLSSRVASDRDLAGYRWGKVRKRALLLRRDRTGRCVEMRTVEKITRPRPRVAALQLADDDSRPLDAHGWAMLNTC